jgi:hypothetical protein
MAKRTRSAAAAPRLQAWHAVGDQRSLRAEARRVLDAPEAAEADREAARAALARTRPEPAAAIAAAVGLLLFTAVALLGILGHR